MTFTLFIALLTVFATITGLLTEAAKKMLNEHSIKYASNVLACITACVIGVCGTSIYYVLFDIAFNAHNIICIALMGIGSAVGSMVGYDKVVQAIQQLRMIKN